MADIRQAEGGFAALRFLQTALDDGLDLSEQLIQRAHELTFAEADDRATRGNYRRVEVEITGTHFEPTPSVYIPERMASLVSSCTRSKRHPIMISALFHLEFESIHPFINANGRTGRLISNFMLMARGYEPINIHAESRSRYINTLKCFQERDDPYPFVEFFCSNLIDRQERICALLHSSHEPISSDEKSAIRSYIEGEEFISSAAPGIPSQAHSYRQGTPQATPQVNEKVDLLLVALGDDACSTTELMKKLNLSDRKHFRQAYLAPALNGGYIERTIPNKPNSPHQKYKRTGR